MNETLLPEYEASIQQDDARDTSDPGNKWCPLEATGAAVSGIGSSDEGCRKIEGDIDKSWKRKNAKILAQPLRVVR